jgi:hypothetical protein
VVPLDAAAGSAADPTAAPTGDAAIAIATGPGDAGAPPDPSAMRDKLRALARAHDWTAVLEVADLDRDDPAAAAIVADARRQYLAQQGRAIDAQIRQGNCPRARDLAAAAHAVVPDDTTLDARARACRPHVTPPAPPPTIGGTIAGPGPVPGPGSGDEPGEEPDDSTRGELQTAQRAALRGEWDQALSAARTVLQRTPRSPLALRIGVVSACHLQDEATARALLRRIPSNRQRALRQQCAAQGVLL